MVTPASDPAPEQFGPYEVYERLGMGGMATVYRAKKRGPAGFERSVALKRMLSHLAEDQNFVESFIREAKVASLLQHPNIAQVYDFGRISGSYYIAMELVAGFDVRKLLRYANRANEAIPLPVILSIVGELCDALDYAHTFVDEQGQPLHIVHRDVSPSNLIIAHTGHMKVIDFGIAKASSRQLHTESGQVKGKLGYMSPEVALGLPVGPVSDIFSVGVVAWELATASPLFSARTDYETMRKIREEPIAPPSRLNPTIPAKLDRIILSALDREPDTRLPSARLFRQAIDEVASETATHISARAVSEWMIKFAQPDDSWARALTSSPAPAGSGPYIPPGSSRPRSPSGRALPLPAEPPTAVLRSARTPTPLRRSAADIELAAEIWGDDVRTVDQAGATAAAPDFHRHVATPLPTQMPSAMRPQPVTAAPRASKKPLAILGVLALIAAALAAILIVKRSSAIEDGTLRFQIEPAGAQVTLDGKLLDAKALLGATLAPGAYPITVELDGYEPWASTITVREGDSQTIRVALDKEETEIAIHDPPPEPAVQAPQQQDPPQQVAAAEPKRVTAAPKVTTKRDPKKGTAKLDKQVAELPKPEPKPEPKQDPPKVEPPKPDPPKPDPPKPPEAVKPIDPKPARTPMVAAASVTKVSGEVPTLRAKNAEGSGDVLAKLCIDEQGKVSSVKIAKSNPEIAGQLQTALASWRYKPFTREGKPLAVCFPLSLRVVVKSS
ncbi:MAG TPA: protein kinase [Kofleriaceae bacterium]